MVEHEAPAPLVRKRYVFIVIFKLFGPCQTILGVGLGLKSF